MKKKTEKVIILKRIEKTLRVISYPVVTVYVYIMLYVGERITYIDEVCLIYLLAYIIYSVLTEYNTEVYSRGPPEVFFNAYHKDVRRR